MNSGRKCAESERGYFRDGAAENGWQIRWAGYLLGRPGVARGRRLSTNLSSAWARKRHEALIAPASLAWQSNERNGGQNVGRM